MARKRLTNRAPAQKRQRQAAQPPASYDWTPEHPAYNQPDPEVDQYLIDNDGNGTGSEPSDFNEDVHKGPYVNSGHPAMPGESEEGHPAKKASARKQAFMKRRAAERKAAKCIRIAQSLLGESATVEAIEDQAVDLMDLPDSQIQATLDRLSATFLADQNDPAGDALAPMEEAVIQTEANEDEVESLLAEMLEEANGVDAEDEVEALLAEMIQEADEAPAVPSIPEAMVAELEEPVACEANEIEAPIANEEFIADEVEGELGLDMLAEDPMGLTEEANEMDELLATLYAGKFAKEEKKEGEDKEEAKEADEKEDDKEAEEAEASDDEKESSKKASLKPQARKASKGPKSLGTVTKTAASELNELAALWETAPDVSGFFDS